MSSLKSTLASLNVKPSKGRGQNFLESRHDAERLVPIEILTDDNTILEIVPGLCALTEILIEKNKKICCVEIEDQFVRYLSNKFFNAKEKLDFINADFRTINLSEQFGEERLNILSNLPYVFSTEAILWLIENRKNVESASLLVQKEFAERLASEEGCKAYGSISVHSQFYFDIELGVEVPGTAFFPAAGVPSQQIILKHKVKNYSLSCEEDFFERVVRASFSMRRKRLANCLKSKFPQIEKEKIDQTIEKLNLSSTVRAEELSVAQFCKLADGLLLLLQ